jgi:YtxH-like protein
MFNSPSPPRPTSPGPKAPPPGSVPQPQLDGAPHETVPDWNNIGLFTAGIALGAILGASVALLWAPASGDETRHRIGRRFGGGEDVWDELAEELELAAAEREEEAEEEEEEISAAVKT